MFVLKKARQFNYPKLIIRSGVEQVRKQESILEKVFVVVWVFHRQNQYFKASSKHFTGNVGANKNMDWFSSNL